jgi:hypothetical protein
MLMLYAIAAGLVIGRLAGGRLDGLATVRFRAWPVALGGLLFQLVLFSGPVESRIGDLGPILYVASSGVVFAVLLVNLRQPGFPLLALGAGANLLAIVANGGYMPSSPEAWAALTGVPALPTDDYSNSALMSAKTHFPALGDIFVFPRPLPMANVFSIGDVLIAVGAAWFLVSRMRLPSRPTLDLRGAIATRVD